ncbi:hypothetical protein RJT34_12878 [Clitoria ternatea]|uniref:Exocyst subunit Exo70 family protein n=1 Tax=Clitoria ternatea TaxID=43366 RepID=A0AAN9PJR5_CLITE
MQEFESAIQKESSKILVPGGEIHPLTCYVMNYIAFLTYYSNALADIVVDWSQVRCRNLTSRVQIEMETISRRSFFCMSFRREPLAAFITSSRATFTKPLTLPSPPTLAMDLKVDVEKLVFFPNIDGGVGGFIRWEDEVLLSLENQERSKEELVN